MRVNKDHWLYTMPVAHRGLWGGDVAENSATAYKNAAEKGYPIEIDLYQSKDGVLYSFHDGVLKRMTGQEGYICDKTSEEIDAYVLTGTENERIPRFTEVLEIAEGKSPLLIELKDSHTPGFIENVVNLLKNYKGEFAIQSFDPRHLLEVKKLAPEYLRGILATEAVKGRKLHERLVLKYMIMNNKVKPDFISYNYTGLPLPKKKHKDIPVLAWTVTSEETEKSLKGKADNIIFELFTPEKYKNRNIL